MVEVYPALLRVLGVLGATGSQLMRSGVGGRKRGVEPTGRVKRVPRPISGLGAEKEDNWVSSLKLNGWTKKQKIRKLTVAHEGSQRGIPSGVPIFLPHGGWSSDCGVFHAFDDERIRVGR